MWIQGFFHCTFFAFLDSVVHETPYGPIRPQSHSRSLSRKGRWSASHITSLRSSSSEVKDQVISVYTLRFNVSSPGVRRRKPPMTARSFVFTPRRINLPSQRGQEEKWLVQLTGSHHHLCRVFTSMCNIFNFPRNTSVLLAQYLNYVWKLQSYDLSYKQT